MEILSWRLYKHKSIIFGGKMKAVYLLGIDIGTSACKVAIFDRNGQVKAAATGDYPVYYPKEGWAEQKPEEWWEAVCQAIKKTLEKGKIQPEEIAESESMVRAGLRLRLIKKEMY